MGVSGSSPRVRGKRRWALRGRHEVRLIPACAGKTSGTSSSPSATPAHPRACGENSVTAIWAMTAWGSSPRVRGKHVHEVGPGVGDRLIPACAGKTGSRSRACGPEPAHPRACGENHLMKSVEASLMGSSPRVRGKLLILGDWFLRFGLIPARAGKTCPASSRSRPPAAHPRACGENAPPAAEFPLLLGSSPRVRGKHLRLVVDADRDRLIPARAGKTEAVRSAQLHRPAHPRACGENRPSTSKSPRDWAHPRACGENLVRVCKKQLAAGSSPRVRGKLGERPAVVGLRGLIPARAGKTPVP